MMRRVFHVLCLLPSLTLASPVIAAGTDPIEAARLSGRVFARGVAGRDPLLMIAAARLAKQSRVPSVDRAPLRDGPVPGGDLPAPPDWRDMLDAALALDPGDPAMAALAADVRAASDRGVATGRIESRARIRAGGRDTYRPLLFSGGAWADVYVEGAGDADLNLIVRDGAGRTVCSDSDISAIAYCGWRPGTSDSFAVEVLNAGRVATTYRMMTN